MRFQFSFKHMEVSQSLQTYTQDKIEQVVNRFVTKPVEIRVTFAVERHLFTAHCELTGGDNFSLSVTHSSEDMYAAVDQMAEKMNTLLRRKKEKIKTHKGNPNIKSARLSEGGERDGEIDAADIIKYEQARQKLFARAR